VQFTAPGIDPMRTEGERTYPDLLRPGHYEPYMICRISYACMRAGSGKARLYGMDVCQCAHISLHSNGVITRRSVEERPCSTEPI
jgi:hypothetical protein